MGGLRDKRAVVNLCRPCFRGKGGMVVTRRSHPTRVWLPCMAAAIFCVGALVLAAEAPVEDKADAPKPQGAGPADPPPEYRAAEPDTIEGPSVIPDEPAGIAVGQYAPDFELEPIEPYAKLAEWLENNRPQAAPAYRVRYRRGFLGRRRRVIERSVDRAPPSGSPLSADDKIRLSQLIGKQPVLLLYGSYT